MAAGSRSTNLGALAVVRGRINRGRRHAMKWLGRLVKRFVRLTVFASALTVAIILLDALLSPDGKDVHRG